MRRKTKKVRKYRGSKTHGGGCKKKRRGAGNRGGRGRAGLHKHKWSYIVKYEPDHFKRPSQKSIQTKLKFLNLDQVDMLSRKENKKELDLSKFKILGKGELTKPIKIKALSFSKKAREKIEKAGGTAEALKKPKVKAQRESKTNESELIPTRVVEKPEVEVPPSKPTPPPPAPKEKMEVSESAQEQKLVQEKAGSE